MYTKHFGLHMLPFENVPDPKFFFDQGEHARVRNRITESFKAGRGLTVVTGPIGSGKTTLSQMVISEFSDDIKLIWMAEPPLNSTDLFLFIAEELGIKSSSTERVFVLRDIKEALLKINSEGIKCLMIIDESHLMADDVLDGIRILNNLEIGSTKLIQILLLGQEELMKTINRPELEPFRQRIATLESMGKMNAERIRRYVSHRIQIAGGSSSMLDDTGWEALVLAFGSGSTPRVINTLCDRSLNAACEREKKIVDVDDVYEAAMGMGLQKEIFFYKIALKKGEQGKQVPSNGGNGSVKETETASNKLNHSFNNDSQGTHVQNEDKMPETINSNQKEPDIAWSISFKDQKSRKVPVLIISLSVAALILSFLFYCQRSGSAGAMTCLLEMIGF
jgi:MSHA biogenesis protein MshM